MRNSFELSFNIFLFKLYVFDNRGNACFKCHRKISTIFTDHFSSYCAGLFESHAQSPFGLNKLSARLDRSRVMSGKVKQKSSATAADSSTQSINEKILKECHTLYIDPDNGELIFSYFARGGGLNITFHKGMGRWISVISFIYSRLGTFHILGRLPIKIFSSCFIFYWRISD